MRKNKTKQYTEHVHVLLVHFFSHMGREVLEENLLRLIQLSSRLNLIDSSVL